MDAPAALRLRLDGDALVANWRWLKARAGGAACGAAIKADGYGLGARGVMARLAAAGCRDFYVATWAEAAALMPLEPGLALSVLHGVRDADMAAALATGARPVLNSPAQIARWRAAGGGVCDVMVDTGINRLGLDHRADIAGAVAGLEIATLMSHLAAADEDGGLSRLQRERFRAVAASIPAARLSLANSAGICLGRDYAFDLVRPGLALYGGVPRREAAGHIAQVVRPEAAVIQRRRVAAGDSVGYNATFTADRPIEAAVLQIGYADGYLRGFSGRGAAMLDGLRLPVLGRVSMDLLIVDVSAAPQVAEGDWLAIDYALADAAAESGLSQYELLTGLGARFERVWDNSAT